MVAQLKILAAIAARGQDRAPKDASEASAQRAIRLADRYRRAERAMRGGPKCINLLYLVVLPENSDERFQWWISHYEPGLFLPNEVMLWGVPIGGLRSDAARADADLLLLLVNAHASQALLAAVHAEIGWPAGSGALALLAALRLNDLTIAQWLFDTFHPVLAAEETTKALNRDNSRI